MNPVTKKKVGLRMKNFRTKFTKWYYRKGYTIRYDPCDYADFVGRVVYDCPGWVRPLCEYFFSPSVYYREVINSKGE